MNNRFIKYLASVLALLMIFSTVLAACTDVENNGQGEESSSGGTVTENKEPYDSKEEDVYESNPSGGSEAVTEGESNESSTEGESNESSTEGESNESSTEGESNESSTEGESNESSTEGGETMPEDSNVTTDETVTEETEPEITEYEEILNFEGSKDVEYAHHIKDKVNVRYLDPQRSAVLVENMRLRLIHGINANQANTGFKNLVNSIENTKGGVYVSNTMDAFVTVDGKTYYASDWVNGSSLNIYRAGYYYQEARITDQGFGDSSAIMGGAFDLDISNFKPTGSSGDSTYTANADGSYTFYIKNSGDAGIQTVVDTNDNNVSSRNYDALLITLKTSLSYSAQVFYRTNKVTKYDESASKHISLIPGDDYHTYIVRLDDIDFNGFFRGLRIDFDGIDPNGEKIDVKSIKLVKLEDNTVPVRFDRGFHAYSDKLHQELHFVTTGVSELTSYGMITEIAESTVNKILVKDKNGEHYDLIGIDWSTAEYVAFDINGVGIFGYILAPDESSGKLSVALENGIYKIKQEYVLEEGTKTKKNTNFYMGNRIYTDESHSFSAFRREAEIERNPLGAENIVVKYDRYNQALFVGYDHLRGAYEISINHTSFNPAYNIIWNRHYKATVTVKGDDKNRKLYLYTSAGGGNLECAAVLDKNDMMLPIPLEVIKNFGGDGEESIFIKDISYSEVYMPVIANAGSEHTFSILNMYQNWGKNPLKQLSWIQYYAPYYHLSTGVTETNCISIMFGGRAPGFQYVNNAKEGILYEYHVVSGKTLDTLPDFRAMSAKMWDDQPQHNSAACVSWLEYIDKDGNYYATDFVNDKIEAAGPTYADITVDYVSDDGKIDAFLRHAEMPQTDENRTYYSLRYEVKDTVSFADMMKDFTIIEINSRFATYENIGYLNKSGECVIEATNKSSDSRYITLGETSPYFSIFGILNNKNGRATNYALIIKDYDIVLGGEEFEGRFVLEEWLKGNLNYTRLTLDAGEITLKAGDYINIDMILMPWGTPTVEDDSNVRQVRKDSCLEPFKVEPIVGEVIADSFIPKLKAVDNVAEFTFSGGHNNGVVRVYGFDKLTSPTVYEKNESGDWEKIDLSSITTPDVNGNAHYYDGYTVFYDGDGTYSYSFVIQTEQGAARTFRIVAEDFVPYPPEPNAPAEDPIPDKDNPTSDDLVDPEEKDPEGEYAPKLYYSAQDFYLFAKDENVYRQNLDKYFLNKDELGFKYATYFSYGEEYPEAYITPFAGDAISSSRFVAIKYRTKTKNISVDIWLHSDAVSPEGRIGFVAKGDGEWQYAVFDAVALLDGIYDGEKLTYFRIDFLNGTPALPKDSSIDIAYVAFFESEEEAYRFEMGDSYKSTEEIKAENNASCFGESSLFKDSSVVYVANLDFINAQPLSDNGGNSKFGVSIYKEEIYTFSSGKLVFTGWAIADGGIKNYVYSIDGGNTWYAVAYPTGSGLTDAHYNIASKRIGGHTFSDGSNKNSIFAGTKDHGENILGVPINLYDHDGETLTVIFGAVPMADPESICLIAKLENVKVTVDKESYPTAPESNASVALPEIVKSPEEIKAEKNATCFGENSEYKDTSVVYGANLDFINAQTLSDNGGNSKYGVSIYENEITTFSNGHLVFTGWAIADGGIKDYVYSIDGGNTWFIIACQPGDGIADAHFNVLKGMIGEHSFSEGSNAKSTFSGSLSQGENIAGIRINLSAHAGKTLSLIFGAIPVAEPDSICLIAKLESVKLPAPKTEEEIKAEKNATCFGENSEYKDTSVVYGANLDFINAQTLSDNGGNSKYGVSIYENEITTFSNGHLVFTGWAIADGGIKDYVYSIDGGNTWSVIACQPGDGAGTAHYVVLKKRIGEYEFSEGSNIKSTFSGALSQGENISGIRIDLSAHAGKTLSVIFGAIPVAEPDSICLMAKLTNINIVVQ